MVPLKFSTAQTPSAFGGSNGYQIDVATFSLRHDFLSNNQDILLARLEASFVQRSYENCREIVTRLNQWDSWNR